MAFEHVDEIIGALKTQFPLLALSMEMLVDQLYQRFKPTGEEEIHKLITALLQDALLVCPSCSHHRCRLFFFIDGQFKML